MFRYLPIWKDYSKLKIMRGKGFEPSDPLRNRMSKIPIYHRCSLSPAHLVWNRRFRTLWKSLIFNWPDFALRIPKLMSWNYPRSDMRVSSFKRTRSQLSVWQCFWVRREYLKVMIKAYYFYYCFKLLLSVILMSFLYLKFFTIEFFIDIYTFAN